MRLLKEYVYAEAAKLDCQIFEARVRIGGRGPGKLLAPGDAEDLDAPQAFSIHRHGIIVLPVQLEPVARYLVGLHELGHLACIVEATTIHAEHACCEYHEAEGRLRIERLAWSWAYSALLAFSERLADEPAEPYRTEFERIKLDGLRGYIARFERFHA